MTVTALWLLISLATLGQMRRDPIGVTKALDTTDPSNSVMMNEVSMSPTKVFKAAPDAAQFHARKRSQSWAFDADDPFVVELGGWSPGRRRSPARRVRRHAPRRARARRLVARSTVIAGAAERAGMLVVELELGGRHKVGADAAGLGAKDRPATARQAAFSSAGAGRFDLEDLA